MRENSAMMGRIAKTLVGFGLLIATSCFASLVAAEPPRVEVSQFSGKPVPRFESLRYAAVHGRQGPSLDHPILWRYEKLGLPMLVVRETNGWRRVRDQDGDEVWVQARMLSDTRTVILTQDQVVRRNPDQDAQALARVKPGVVAKLEMCEPQWCKLSFERQEGWVERQALWGVETSTAGL